MSSKFASCGHIAFASGRIFLCIVVVHMVLLVYGLTIHSPTWDEIGHMGAGGLHWTHGDFSTYRVNPPLVRLVATLPVYVSGATWPPLEPTSNPYSRYEFTAGSEFISLNPSTFQTHFILARLAVTPFSLVGAVVCFCWARDLWGRGAGIFSVLMWCFCPSVVGNAQLITPDVPAASLAAATSYLLWRWLGFSSWRNALLAGLSLGIALLTKGTLLLLFPLGLLTFAAWLVMNHTTTRARLFLQFSVINVLGIYILNLGYLFEGSLVPLGQYEFTSKSLNANFSDDGTPSSGNCFQGTALGALLVPLPYNYVRGLDLQKYDFERPRWSYLNGEWRQHGWWYYYLYAILVKLPVGDLVILLIAIWYNIIGVFRGAPYKNLIVLMLPVLIFFIVLCTQTGLSRHHRYAIVVLPYLFVLCGSIARGPLGIAKVGWLLLSYSVCSSMWYYPHSLSYFNEIVGGPRNGAQHLLDSNIDWGQDMYLLKDWCDQHPDAKPFYLSPKVPHWLLDPGSLGFEKVSKLSDALSDNDGILPGWHAVSVASLHSRTGYYRHFSDLAPVDRIGYSMYIFHISHDQAVRVRDRLLLANHETVEGDD